MTKVTSIFGLIIKMYYNVNDEMIKSDLVDITKPKDVEKLIKDQITNIYCDDVGFDYVNVTCRDYGDK